MKPAQPTATELLGAIVDVCRQKGVTRAHVDAQGMSFDVELGPAPAIPRGPVKELTAEEKAAAAAEARRLKLTRQLGRAPTDDEMRSLP